MKIFFLPILYLLAMFITLFPQENYEYTQETDPLVLEKLEQWQNIKF